MILQSLTCIHTKTQFTLLISSLLPLLFALLELGFLFSSLLPLFRWLFRDTGLLSVFFADIVVGFRALDRFNGFCWFLEGTFEFLNF